jgi:hypothetical protein
MGQSALTRSLPTQLTFRYTDPLTIYRTIARQDLKD